MKIIIIIRGPLCAGKTTTCQHLRNMLHDSSLVTADRIKRAIDHRKATKWRDNIAFKTTLVLADFLIEKKRTLIIDIHSSDMGQYYAFKKLAKKTGYKFHSFLLYPPINVCLERNKKRPIPDVLYTISDNEIKKYWKNTKKLPNEMIFDTSVVSGKKVALNIYNAIF